MDFKKDVSYRKNKLQQLLRAIQNNESKIIDALYLDFKKPAFEAVLTETSYVISELKETIKNIHRWARSKSVTPSLLNFPSSDYILKEPYGKVLILAPWNYPFQLAICPLVAALAAGNQVTLKPSELTPHTTKIIATIIAEVFEINHVAVAQGGVEIAQQLLAQRWDYIFFTGSVPVGKIVAKAAAEHLTPVTLELGGKNPCIVDDDIDVTLVAKRIVWGKFVNAGQTCIAPDYLIVNSKVKMALVEALKNEIKKAYGINPKESSDYPRIINRKNWNRLTQLVEGTTIIYGGESSENDLYIAPTIIEVPNTHSDIMKEEIFGPILPILSFHSEAEIDKIIGQYEKPLALYVFSNRTAWAKKIMENYSFGGGCINDTLVHFLNNRMPFGGVGHSGIGAYHGKLSFDLFCHHKAISKKGNWLDISLRYAPYKNKLVFIKKVLNWL